MILPRPLVVEALFGFQKTKEKKKGRVKCCKCWDAAWYRYLQEANCFSLCKRPVLLLLWVVLLYHPERLAKVGRGIAELEWHVFLNLFDTSSPLVFVCRGFHTSERATASLLGAVLLLLLEDTRRGILTREHPLQLIRNPSQEDLVLCGHVAERQRPFELGVFIGVLQDGEVMVRVHAGGYWLGRLVGYGVGFVCAHGTIAARQGRRVGAAASDGIAGLRVTHGEGHGWGVAGVHCQPGVCRGLENLNGTLSCQRLDVFRGRGLPARRFGTGTGRRVGKRCLLDGVFLEVDALEVFMVLLDINDLGWLLGFGCGGRVGC